MQAIRVWVWLHDASTHEVELRHAFNKAHNSQQSRFEMLAARLVNVEAKHAVPAPSLPQAPAGSAIAAEEVRATSATRRGKSSLQIFHRLCARRDRAIDAMPAGGAATKGYWRRVMQEWEALSEAEQADICEIAQGERQAALSNATSIAAGEIVADTCTPGDAVAVPCAPGLPFSIEKMTAASIGGWSDEQSCVQPLQPFCQPKFHAIARECCLSAKDVCSVLKKQHVRKHKSNTNKHAIISLL